MKLETLQFLRQVLNGLTLDVGAPDFVDVAPKVLEAIAEVDRGIRDWTSEPWPGTVPPVIP